MKKVLIIGIVLFAVLALIKAKRKKSKKIEDARTNLVYNGVYNDISYCLYIIYCAFCYKTYWRTYRRSSSIWAYEFWVVIFHNILFDGRLKEI